MLSMFLSARRQPRSDGHAAATSLEAVTIRLATAADDEAIARVAGRDSRRVPPAPWLVAERGERIDAVLSLRTREYVADPFVRTADLVALLRRYADDRAAAGPRLRSGRTRERTACSVDLGLAGAGGCP
jgi:hypothetical protein